MSEKPIIKDRFPMNCDWKPNITVEKVVIDSFIEFWTNKPDVKKTDDDWNASLQRAKDYAE